MKLAQWVKVIPPKKDAASKKWKLFRMVKDVQTAVRQGSRKPRG